MPNLLPRFSIIIIWLIITLSLITFSIILVSSSSASSSSSSWCPQNYNPQTYPQFKKKTNMFWEFEEKSNTWVEVKLPYDILSCTNDNCTKVGTIDGTEERIVNLENELDGVDEKENLQKVKVKKKKKKKTKDGAGGGEEEGSVSLPFRKRVSVIKMSETSIWVTGESGSTYERFWNGLQWVIAPHDLPVSAGFAVSIFIVNQTILALSEAGNLFQMKLGDNSQPIWVDCSPILDHNTRKKMEKDAAVQLKSGVASQARERVYFCTKDGWLLELSEIEPPRWINHGRPPGANVAEIADAATIRPKVIFTVSSSGDLYEFDRNSKPLWKKHVWSEGSKEDIALAPSTGCSFHGINGAHSASLFLLTKGGNLVERRLHRRKWKWIVHGSPNNHHLTSITPIPQDETNDQSYIIFLTTAAGLVFEYHIPKDGIAKDIQSDEFWVNHMHPLHAKVAKGITGLQLQTGRIIFPLDDGRLGELHQSGLGGESLGPSPQVNIRRKTSVKYVWSILDAPETEGWNAEYCTEEQGPSNCIIGVKVDLDDAESTRSRRRKGSKVQEFYLTPAASIGSSEKLTEEYPIPENWVDTNFRLRVMHGGTSFFLVTDGGLTFEYLNTDSAWFWLKHEHSTAMKGALGNYNGSLFLVDEHKNLLIRERSSRELRWINCTAMKKGREVTGGPPWDFDPGKARKVTAEDALFFVSKSGRLLQFTVALRKFKWKDCKSPPNTKIASIVDQEVLRENIVFVIGENSRLYQYNKVTELWHGHYQSQHMVLSRLPGTAMRPSSLSLTGSLFMLSEDGRLIEYHWNPLDGWNWVEHGTPYISVTLVGSTGPCLGGNQLFLIGSDGNVYLRHSDQSAWKWADCGFPYMGSKVGEGDGTVKVCVAVDSTRNFENVHQENQEAVKNCDSKVASTRPIAFTDNSVIFELRDGRLAEMRQTEEESWIWSRTIATPTSLCNLQFLTAAMAA